MNVLTIFLKTFHFGSGAPETVDKANTIANTKKNILEKFIIEDYQLIFQMSNLNFHYVLQLSREMNDTPVNQSAVLY